MDDEPSEAAKRARYAGVQGVQGDGGGASSLKEEGVAGATGVTTLSALPKVVNIAPDGDVVLDVHFETSTETLQAARKAAKEAAAAYPRRPGASGGSEINPTKQTTSSPRAPVLQPHLRVAYRVQATQLRKHSRYFANLLGSGGVGGGIGAPSLLFQEAQAVDATLAALAADNLRPADADPARLPWVRIDDDDESSRSAGREIVFAELLHILHGTAGGMGDGKATSSGKKKKEKKTKADVSKTATSKAVAKSDASQPTGSKTKPAADQFPSADSEVSKPTASTSSSSGPANPPGRAHRSHWFKTHVPTLTQLSVLALLADRFACTTPVGAYVRNLHVRYPPALVEALHGIDPLSGLAHVPGISTGLPVLANEEAVRQKIFVSWTFEQPLRFQAATRELIQFGSRLWRVDYVHDEDSEEDAKIPRAAWWDLPDELEDELQFRRACILNCITSVPRHFLGLYTTRKTRHCQMGYTSSAACDSFQLGEMIKFLCQKNLMCLQDIGTLINPGPEVSALADHAIIDVYQLLATLRQCPSYQLDNNHVNCGLRTRLLPILRYIEVLLGSSSVSINMNDWTNNRENVSWIALVEADEELYKSETKTKRARVSNVPEWDITPTGPVLRKPEEEKVRMFRFTRTVAHDERQQIDGSMTAERKARWFFTCKKWNWTPE